MTQELSGIVTDAIAIQKLLKKLLKQLPGNKLARTALFYAEGIDEVAEDLLRATPEGVV